MSQNCKWNPTIINKLLNHHNQDYVSYSIQKKTLHQLDEDVCSSSACENRLKSLNQKSVHEKLSEALLSQQRAVREEQLYNEGW